MTPIKSSRWLHTDTPRAAPSRPVHPQSPRWMLQMEKIKRHPNKCCFCTIFCMWASSWSAFPTSPLEQVTRGCTLCTCKKRLAGWEVQGDGNLRTVKRPDVSLRPRSLLGKNSQQCLPTARLLHWRNSSEKTEHSPHWLCLIFSFHWKLCNYIKLHILIICSNNNLYLCNTFLTKVTSCLCRKIKWKTLQIK